MSATLRLPEPAVYASSEATPDDWRDAWVRSFGSRWYVDLTVMAVVAFCFGAIRPLSDPDLPMHLSVGEWILRHGAVPHVEPFAWTRPGAPYYAYSWLQQTAYYAALQSLGHVGLRAVQGVLVLGSAAAMVVLARAARWRPSQAVMLAGFNLIVGSFFVGFLRPQSVLLITLPLVWAGTFWLSRGENVVPSGLLIFLASAATANSHLFFPLTLAPAALYLAHPPARSRDWVIGVAAVLLGWIASPYALHWFDVFRHNFGPNLLTRPPSAVTELQPGFVSMLYPKLTPLLAVVACMLAIPWALERAPIAGRARLMAAVYWGGGLILFGFASRLFLLWWLLSLPAVGWTIAHLTRSGEEGPPRVAVRLLGLTACVLIVATQLIKTRDLWAMEGDAALRTLPTMAALPAEKLAGWLERNGGADRYARMMSTFTFGSYLTWRLPHISQSIDSRGIFPDSVTGAEAVVLAQDRDVPLGPWRSADLAILPLRFRAAAVLDTASNWRRMTTVPGSPEVMDSVGLWVRREWWAARQTAPPMPRR